jgi:hypothetical protein
MARDSNTAPVVVCPAVPAESLPVLPSLHMSAGTRLYRVCSSLRDPLEMDSREVTDFRFSPLRAESGSVVPVLYTAHSPEVCLLETVLRYRLTNETTAIFRRDLENRQLVEYELQEPLKLVTLASAGAHRLGEGIAVSIAHADARQYSRTRAWAEAIYVANPDSEGLSWISNQHLHSQNVMFWAREGKRQPNALLKVTPDPASLLSRRVVGMLAELASETGHVLDLGDMLP